MSVQCVARIIGRAFLDHGYRSLLLDDAAAALAGYTLTAEEMQALQSLAFDRFSSVEAALYDRMALGLASAEREQSSVAQEIVLKKLNDLFDSLT